MHTQLVVLGRKVQVLHNICILFFNFLNVGNSKQKSRHSGVVNPALAHWAWGGGHARGWSSITCALVTPLPRRQRASCVTILGRVSFPCPDVVQMQLGLPPTREPWEPCRDAACLGSQQEAHVTVDGAFSVFPGLWMLPF